MARPVKRGLDYFSFDVNFFADKKIKVLKTNYGADGIAIYLYILCRIYEDGYYTTADDDFIFIISDDLNMSINKVQQVLKFLLERSMFDNTLFQSDTILTSTGIQKRFQMGVKSRASKKPILIERFWLLSQEETETFIKVKSFLNKSKINPSYSKINPSYSPINDTKESKVKESKVKESKELAQDEYDLLVSKYGKALIDKYVERTTQYKCCNHDTIVKWIEEDKDKKPKNNSNNMESRNYDIGALEQQLLNTTK